MTYFKTNLAIPYPIDKKLAMRYFEENCGPLNENTEKLIGFARGAVFCDVIALPNQAHGVSLELSPSKEAVGIKSALAYLCTRCGNGPTIVTYDIWARLSDQLLKQKGETKLIADKANRIISTDLDLDMRGIESHIQSVIGFFYISVIFPHRISVELRDGSSSAEMLESACSVSVPVYDGDTLLAFHNAAFS